MKYWKEILIVIAVAVVIAFCLYFLKVSIDNSAKLDHIISTLDTWTLTE